VWFSALGATAGLLAGVVVGLNLVAIALRLTHFWATHARTPQLLTLLFVTGSALGELLALGVLGWVLRRKDDSLLRLRLCKTSPWMGWIAALALTAFYVVPAVNGLHNGAAHLPWQQIFFDPSFFHLYTALVVGLSAGLCEEVFFRAFVMDRLSRAGYGWVVQIAGSGMLFGLAHGLYGLSQGWSAGLDIMAHTALLGALYAIVYLLSRRSLMPCIVAHLLNDAIVLPWIFLQMFHPR
jgi:membrane protease YdiL (CAAX protease family)